MNFGQCQLLVEGKVVLIKISELSEKLGITEKALREHQKNGRLEKLINIHNCSFQKLLNKIGIPLPQEKSTPFKMFEMPAKGLVHPSYYEEMFGLNSGDWDIIKKQKACVQDPFGKSRIKLSPLEAEALPLLSKNSPRSKEEDHLLKMFFAHIYQNADFNQRISKYEDDQEDAIVQVNCQFLHSFSFKSKFFPDLSTLASKLTYLSDLIFNQKDKAIDPNHPKITLLDIDHAEKIQHMTDMMNWIETTKIDIPCFLFLKEKVKEISHHYELIEDKFINDYPLQSGDIQLDVIRKYKPLKKYCENICKACLNNNVS